MRKQITDLQDMKNRGEKITMVTCYDSTFAQLVEKTEIDSILVGDSMGNTMLGYDTTLPVTVDDIIRSAAAVVRRNARQFIVADMPWGSYHVSKKLAVQNAVKIVQETGVNAVKLEGATPLVLQAIEAIVDAQIPVVAHLGLTPQSVNAFGGFKVQARDDQAKDELLNNSNYVQRAGASMLVLEGVPLDIAKTVSQELDIPVIGIGAGNGTDGQVLVLQDMLGMNEGVPKFVKKYANLNQTIVEAFNKYNQEVKSGEFPTDQYSFHA
ncbi:3-methyl-2-oxobutanoate hydroxymethyltransferase [Actinomycetota bacterium]|nr:3-methyl-2-oxobutanoate hydroxymethyltransferase [Actinomycetota bacterium]